MQDSDGQLYYADYLDLAALLGAQRPLSGRDGRAAHDEMLFIITHQTYELWFKQILHELNSALALFDAVPLDESMLATIVARLERIAAIQQVINQQIGILETMTALDFLDFRDVLTPASGFQSVQFREIELRLGLAHHLQNSAYGRFRPADKRYLEDVARQKSLFELLDGWLARMPFLEFCGFNFWQSYRGAVAQMLAADKLTIETNPLLNDHEKAHQIEQLTHTHESFACLFDELKYRQYQKEGYFKLSHTATLAALFIQLYREQPLLQTPFKLLNILLAIDTHLTAWRSGHAMMVQRMLGTKIGTGGSSGHAYLEATIRKKRIFADLFNLSTFLIPRSKLPKLPAELQSHLGFTYQPVG